jgi:hypothetical protein
LPYRAINIGREVARIDAAIRLKGVISDLEYSDGLMPINSLFMNHAVNPAEEVRDLVV